MAPSRIRGGRTREGGSGTGTYGPGSRLRRGYDVIFRGDESHLFGQATARRDRKKWRQQQPCGTTPSWPSRRRWPRARSCDSYDPSERKSWSLVLALLCTARRRHQHSDAAKISGDDAKTGGRSRSRAFVFASPALERGHRPPSNAARISPNGLRLFEFRSAPVRPRSVGVAGTPAAARRDGRPRSVPAGGRHAEHLREPGADGASERGPRRRVRRGLVRAAPDPASRRGPRVRPPARQPGRSPNRMLPSKCLAIRPAKTEDPHHPANSSSRSTAAVDLRPPGRGPAAARRPAAAEGRACS